MINPERAMAERPHGSESGTLGRKIGATMVLAAVLLSLAQPVLAARVRPRASQPPPRTGQPAGPATPSWIVINAGAGEELSSQEPDRLGAPA
jgi:hypothetical protein